MSFVRNVHERVIAAPAAVVGELLDDLSSPEDPLFPVPAWGPMRFDRPLGIGAAGGHGRVAYRVAEYEPGIRIRFDGIPPWNGFHELTVESLDSGHCRLRHVLEMDFPPARRLAWALLVRPMHDAVLEELLDNARLAATGSLPRPSRRPLPARLLRRLTWARPEAVPVPEGARLLRAALDRPEFRGAYRDAYRIALRPGMPRDPESWRAILRKPFPVLARGDGELLLRVEAGGVAARASILVDAEHVTLGTAAVATSPRGRLRWAVVRRLHPVMARAMLRRTHRRLADTAPGAGARFRARRAGFPGTIRA